MECESPVARVLRNLKLTSADAAALGEVSPTAVSNARNGTAAVPRRLLAAFSEAGVDVEALVVEQDCWRQARTETLRARISGRGGPIPSHKIAEPCGVTK